MEYLQYTRGSEDYLEYKIEVLNLIINGIPSILIKNCSLEQLQEVLNLIINGIPSIR